ncbi:MAG: gliding motility-associated ABC transporter permease subunit GldF, partial [Flavobacteriales bacterium]
QDIGNLDIGSTIGAFLGLFLLASSYVSVGLFCSSLTNNQLVSFILAVCFCFFLYIGFDSISGLFDSVTAGIIEQFGINYHYLSLSRGLIDLRDVLYFLCFNICFLSATMLKLQSRKW